MVNKNKKTLKVIEKMVKFILSPLVSALLLFFVLEFLLPRIFKDLLQTTVINGIISALYYIYRENTRIKSDFNETLKENIANLRRIPDPYEEFSSETLREFIEITAKSKKMWTIDRTNPDAWFLNENLICFLTIQSDRIRRGELEAHRIFIVDNDSYKKERYKQLLILNVYLGICVYLIPKSWLLKKVSNIGDFLNQQFPDLARNEDFIIQKNYPKDWINYLCLEEEFLLYENSAGELDGIGKEIKRTSYEKIKSRKLFPIEEIVYKKFIDYLIHLTTDKNGSILSRLDFSKISTADETWWRQCSSHIEETINNVLRLKKEQKDLGEYAK